MIASCLVGCRGKNPAKAQISYFPVACWNHSLSLVILLTLSKMSMILINLSHPVFGECVSVAGQVSVPATSNKLLFLTPWNGDLICGFLCKNYLSWNLKGKKESALWSGVKMHMWTEGPAGPGPAAGLGGLSGHGPYRPCLWIWVWCQWDGSSAGSVNSVGVDLRSFSACQTGEWLFRMGRGSRGSSQRQGCSRGPKCQNTGGGKEVDEIFCH